MFETGHQHRNARIVDGRAERTTKTTPLNPGDSTVQLATVTQMRNIG